jgi:hypothetical protein
MVLGPFGDFSVPHDSACVADANFSLIAVSHPVALYRLKSPMFKSPERRYLVLISGHGAGIGSAPRCIVQMWVDGAHVMYVGMTAAVGGLRSRLCQLFDFGTGKRVGHRGGRLLWHLEYGGHCWFAGGTAPLKKPIRLRHLLSPVSNPCMTAGVHLPI